MNAGHYTDLFLCLISTLTAGGQRVNIASIVPMRAPGINPRIAAAEWTIDYGNSE